MSNDLVRCWQDEVERLKARYLAIETYGDGWTFETDLDETIDELRDDIAGERKRARHWKRSADSYVGRCPESAGGRIEMMSRRFQADQTATADALCRVRKELKEARREYRRQQRAHDEELRRTMAEIRKDR